jgi:hypothetical protein
MACSFSPPRHQQPPLEYLTTPEASTLLQARPSKLPHHDLTFASQLTKAFMNLIYVPKV